MQQCASQFTLLACGIHRHNAGRAGLSPGGSTTAMNADHPLRYEASTRRVRVEYHGAWLADSARALVLHEARLPPAYYFPREDVQLGLLEKSHLKDVEAEQELFTLAP